MTEKVVVRPDPPLMTCLCCRWYTVKRHYCCKDFRNPIRKATSPACFRWTPSEDAKRAYMTEPANETERWARERIRSSFRKAAYPEGAAQCR